jgi:hypothetical protein
MMNRKSKAVPAPTVMPIDREKWRRVLHLSNFVNTYYQYRDIQSCGTVKKILVVGPGQGLDTQVLGWRGYEVTTFDIDETFEPDVTGSVHDLSMFPPASFDVITVSHVLEHLAEPYLDRCLDELARVGRHSLVYLPVAGRHFQLRAQFDVKGFNVSWIADLFNIFQKPDGVAARYCQGQHFWEVGRRGFRVADLLRRFARRFSVIRHYRNADWNPSYNFVLKAK